MNVGKDQVVESFSNVGICVKNAGWPFSENVVCPGGDRADHIEGINECVELPASVGEVG